MEGVPAELPAVAGLPAQRASQEPSSADVLRSFGLEALVELVEGSASGICVTGEERRWAYVNPAGCRLLGRAFDEVRGEDALLHPAEHERAALLRPEGGQRARDSESSTTAVVRPDGSTVEITWSGSVLHVEEQELAPAVIHPTSVLGAHASVALADEELRRQAARSAAEQERRRLGRDLHDSVSSALFALHTRTQVVERALASGDQALLAEAAKDMRALSGQAIAELRAMVSAMREDGPPGGSDVAHDLPAALEHLAATTRRRDGLDVDLRLVRPLPAVPPPAAGHLARIAAEAVHNCVKHAAADRVAVHLEVRGSELVLAVADEGRGFDPASLPGDGHGQRTMRERAVLCGGWLHVDAAPGRGTRVVARVPLPG